MPLAIGRVIFAVQRPLLVVGFSEVLRRAGFADAPALIDPADLVGQLQPAARWLVMLDGDDMLTWDELELLRRRSPESRFVICCSVVRPELVLAAMTHGLDGIISTRIPIADAAAALIQICSGCRQFRFPDTLDDPGPRRFSLTPRERVVLRMVAEGKLNRQIAVTLATSENNVKTHVNRLLRKTRTSNRRELARAAGAVFAGGEAAEEAVSFDHTWMFGGGAA